MKTKLIIVALTCLLAAPAMAGLQAMLNNSQSTLGGYGTGSFDAYGRAKDDWKAAGVVADYAGTYAFFKTYCVEQQTFNMNTWYDATIDTTIKYNGGEHAPSLVTKSAYAYYRADAFTDGPVDTANEHRALQALLWDQEKVLGGDPITKYWRSQLTHTQQVYYDHYLSDAGTTHAWAGMVKVLNLWDAGHVYEPGYDRQSHLVLVIPAPAAAMLGVIGLGLVGWVKRRLS